MPDDISTNLTYNWETHHWEEKRDAVDPERRLRRTLVTGSAGFIGQHVVARLFEQGESVAGIDLKRHSYDTDTMFIHDLRDPHLGALLARLDITHVIHLAAKVGVRDSIGHEREYVETNVLGTINLLNACVLNKVQSVVLASTSSVYGDSSNADAKFAPLSPYAASKIGMEMIAQSYAKNYGLTIKILRLFSVYGPNIRRDLMIYKIMDALVNHQPITLYDDGLLMRDWTYVENVAASLIGARDNQFGMLYNVGAGNPVSVLDIVRKLAHLSGFDPILHFEAAPITEPKVTNAGIWNGLETLGGAHNQTSLDDGLKKTWDWFSAFEVAEHDEIT